MPINRNIIHSFELTFESKIGFASENPNLLQHTKVVTTGGESSPSNCTIINVDWMIKFDELIKTIAKQIWISMWPSCPYMPASHCTAAAIFGLYDSWNNAYKITIIQAAKITQPFSGCCSIMPCCNNLGIPGTILVALLFKRTSLFTYFIPYLLEIRVNFEICVGDLVFGYHCVFTVWLNTAKMHPTVSERGSFTGSPWATNYIYIHEANFLFKLLALHFEHKET